jgi:hypothetical protein
LNAITKPHFPPFQRFTPQFLQLVASRSRLPRPAPKVHSSQQTTLNNEPNTLKEIIMKNAQYIASSNVAKAAFAALAIAVVASFAGGLKASEQNAVAQASAAKMEVRVAQPMVILAKRDIRQLQIVEVIGRRSNASIAQGGTRSNVMNARFAK